MLQVCTRQTEICIPFFQRVKKRFGFIYLSKCAAVAFSLYFFAGKELSEPLENNLSRRTSDMQPLTLPRTEKCNKYTNMYKFSAWMKGEVKWVISSIVTIGGNHSPVFVDSINEQSEFQLFSLISLRCN